MQSFAEKCVQESLAYLNSLKPHVGEDAFQKACDEKQVDDYKKIANKVKDIVE